MPIEHERKFVILHDPEVERRFADEASQVLRIEQNYLLIGRGISVRVRQAACEGVPSWRMTVKRDVGDQTVEVETLISEEDFRKLWPTGTNKVTKVRYIYQGWEVDFFKSPPDRVGKDHRNYFAVAEVELPYWVDGPKTVPDLVRQHLLFEVPLGDKRFSNKKLGDVKYAQRLLESFARPAKAPDRSEIKPYKKRRYR